MKRCAFFVEGQTEMVFVSRLLTEIANKGQIAITKMKASGGAKSPRTLLVIEATRPDPKQEYFVLIVDSGGDSTVKSDVIDQYQSLVGAGYEAIVAIRDVYPLAMGDVGSLRTGLAAGLPQGPVLPVFVLGIMEIRVGFLRSTRIIRIWMRN